MMSRYFLIVCYVTMGFEILNAQSGGSLSIPVDTRSIAMGSTFITNSTAVGMYENLASSALSESKLNIGVSYRPWVNELSDGYAITSVSGRYALSDKHKIVVGYQQLTFPEMTLVDDYGNFESTFKPNEYRIGLGYSYLFNKYTAVSTTMHFFNSEMYQDYSSSSVVFDFGFKSQYKDFEYGLSIKNIGSNLKFDYNEVALPLIIAGGIGYEKLFSEEHNLRGQIDVSYLSTATDESGIGIGMGAEYTLKSMWSLRAGYNLVDEGVGLSHFSFGAGIDVMGFDLSVAYLLSDNAINHNYSLALLWRM